MKEYAVSLCDKSLMDGGWDEGNLRGEALPDKIVVASTQYEWPYQGHYHLHLLVHNCKFSALPYLS